jgi:hypothetical protein
VQTASASPSGNDRLENCERISERQREHRLENHGRVKEQQRLCREKNREKTAAKIKRAQEEKRACIEAEQILTFGRALKTA